MPLGVRLYLICLSAALPSSLLVGGCFGFWLSGGIDAALVVVYLGVAVIAIVSMGMWMTRTVDRAVREPVRGAVLSLGAAVDPGAFKANAPDSAADIATLVCLARDAVKKLAALEADLAEKDQARGRAEKALHQARTLFDSFMENLPGLAAVKDRHGRYLYANARSRKILELEAELPDGLQDSSLWLPCDDAAGGPVILPEQDREGQTLEKLIVSADPNDPDKPRHPRYFATTRFKIPQPGGPDLLGSIALDTTEKIEAEEQRAKVEQQLAQAQKMEAIGTLASGIAHDFNNILSAIMGYVELIVLDMSVNAKVLSQLEQVLKAAHRARELVAQILTFSRKQEQDRKPLDLAPLTKEALKLLRASLPTTVAIRSELDTGRNLVLANATQVHQVIMNLCTNAAHAMEESGGTLTVRLKPVELSEDPGATPYELAAGAYVELRVEDTGRGIKQTILPRIFDPYFTTKEKGKGTGMGLAVVHGIVKSHGGAIHVDSIVGKGTCISVVFPATAGVVKMPTEKTNNLPKGYESILLVDDEPFLVDLGYQMLSRLGYRVTCCTDSPEACDMVCRAPDRFDLVITDMTMPDMTGETLARRIMAVRNDLPVILCTGYSERISEEKAGRLGISAFLMKPLTLGDLSRTVRTVLDRQSPVGYLKAISV